MLLTIVLLRKVGLIMLRSLLALVGVVLAAVSSGCSMCQDCDDRNGPVAESGNFHDFAHSPRSGSATLQSYEGPVDGEPTVIEEEEPQRIPTPAPMSTKRRPSTSHR